MKCIVFSDLHNNYFALEAFYNYLNGISDKFILYFLGDIIGYYQFDVRNINLIKEMIIKWDMKICIGNHDAAFFNYLGLTQIYVVDSNSLNETITRNLENKNKLLQLFNYINLSYFNVEINNKVHILSHGGISDTINDYYYPDLKFLDKFKHKFLPDTNYIFGHTHRPFIENIKNNLFVNVGSLGMPRDGDPRISFLVIDDEDIKIERLFYNLDAQYQYNLELNNCIKNRIYTGGKSKYLDNNLLRVDCDISYIKDSFDKIYIYDRAIYIIQNDVLFQIISLENNKLKFLLRFNSTEILLNSIEEAVRRIKSESF